ncbi:hypothetical protein RO3G_01943 [Rhizopus delemar RA 99-880]|uniref:Uncharacterized protein n=1 Tax=Rhizopus delemar (strain RA 99-880 / ATCC MYA-4621 / FGSC 9543 / NRRL 43880) TaxID=246409 RepID=I1BM09_RHIO9|nr:hypothetical protein RO3G_01943 [Rhizopus delemar RA 99-880]|eukprot:EIE77239.1 hypothetical protein RO3G_01943 [Rhizopus delemar RA 99-880]
MAQTASVPTYRLSSFRNVIYMTSEKIFIEINSYFINLFPKRIRVLCSTFVIFEIQLQLMPYVLD